MEIINNTKVLQPVNKGLSVVEAPAVALSLPAFSLTERGALIDYFLASERVRQSSRETYRRQLKQFFNWLESTGKELSFLDRRDVVAYYDFLESKGLASLSVGGYMTAVRKFFQFTEAVKLFPNIARGIKSPKKKNRFVKQHLKEEEMKALLATVNRRGSLRERVMASLMLRTGLRTIEVSRLDVGDLQSKGGRKVLKLWRKGHSEKDDFVVISDKLYKDLNCYINTERRNAPKNAPLFVSASNNNREGRLTTKTISTFGKKYLKAIGLDGAEYSAHSFRHSTAVQILKLTGDITAVQAVLGHSSPVTSQIYTESVKEELRLEKAPELLLDAVI